jgi:hypothetical protein
MASRNADLFAELELAHQQLGKAGEASLRAAYKFGEVVEEIHSHGYTYAQIGATIGVTGSMPYPYKRLYNAHRNISDLLKLARQLETYDVAKLAGIATSTAYKYIFVCENCGSKEVHRERDRDAETAVSHA